MAKAGRDSNGDPGPAAVECRTCGLSSVCGGGEVVDADAPFRGVPLALVSLGFFFLPLLSAIGGALIGGADPGGQLIGGVVGLGVGMMVAWLAAALATRRLCASRLGGWS